jgi:hypothetical protein
LKSGRRKQSRRRAKLSVALPLEQILVRGDLSQLTDAQKLAYELATCKSISRKVNPLTKPFAWIWFNDMSGKPELQMYATRNCTDQLRNINKISVVPGSLRVDYDGKYCSAVISVRDRKGRTDEEIGVVFAGDATGQALADCKMHASTKAKRRATLSICGLGGFLDESELHSLDGYNKLTLGGRVVEELHPQAEGYKAPVVYQSSPTPNASLHWIPNDETQMAEIVGDEGLKRDHAKMLHAFWDTKQGKYIVNHEQLDFLRNRFAAIDVPFSAATR